MPLEKPKPQRKSGEDDSESCSDEKENVHPPRRALTYKRRKDEPQTPKERVRSFIASLQKKRPDLTNNNQ